MLAHLVINLCNLCTEVQTQALNSHLNIRYATTDLRYIHRNKFSGNVDALGSLIRLQRLCVAFSCCIVHSCLRDIKTIPESTSCPVRCLLLFASSAALCMTAKTMYYNETNLFTQWYPATRHAHQAPIARRWLSNNKFTGSVAAIGNLTKLQVLCVEQNNDDDFARYLCPFCVY